MTPLPWSHTSINGFETCPRQFEATKVIKVFRQSQNEASVWGDEVHRAAEQYLKAGGQKPLASRFSTYKAYLDRYLAMPGIMLTEQEYALDKHLKPCAFLGPDVWARGILDVLVIDGDVAHVFDHKTGKRKKDMQQLLIFALLVFYHHPQVQQCVSAFEWLKTAERDEETYHRHQIPQLWEFLLPKLQRYAEAFHQGIFPPKPSGLCKAHCPVNTCEYHTLGMQRR